MIFDFRKCCTFVRTFVRNIASRRISIARLRHITVENLPVVVFVDFSFTLPYESFRHG